MKEKYQSHGWTTLGSLKQRRAKLDELLSARCFPCQISLHFPRNNRRSSATFRARLHPSKSECYASDPINQDRNVLRAFYEEEEEEEEEEKKEEEKMEKEDRRRRKYRDLQSGWRKSKCRHGCTPSRANLPPSRRGSS